MKLKKEAIKKQRKDPGLYPHHPGVNQLPRADEALLLSLSRARKRLETILEQEGYAL